jgi:hypothetical protein
MTDKARGVFLVYGLRTITSRHHRTIEGRIREYSSNHLESFAEVKDGKPIGKVNGGNCTSTLNEASSCVSPTSRRLPKV